jgi:hypothetical protein
MTNPSGATPGYSTFISHASDDRQIATKVCEQLEASGFRCWMAPRDVRPGQDYPEEIIRGIELSKSLVLILSKKANESSFVRAEVERAYSKGKPVFPVRIEDVLPSRSLELFISTKHWIDAWHGNISQRHAEQLMRELALDSDALVDMEISPKLRRQIQIRRILRIAGAIAGAIAIAVAVGYVMRPAQQKLEFSHSKRLATAFFMGSLVQGNQPIEVAYMLTDGWDNKGNVNNTFNTVKAFEIFEVNERAPLKQIYAADPGIFSGQFQSTQTYYFKIDSLPKKVISCLSYYIPASKSTESSLQGFVFNPPTSKFASFVPTASANFKVYEGAEACRARAAAYARDELKIDVSN